MSGERLAIWEPLNKSLARELVGLGVVFTIVLFVLCSVALLFMV